jgi:hypothetical protein
MNFDWTEYLNLAKELIALAGKKDKQLSCPEAKYRSSISRAYYAAHCHGRNYLIKKVKDLTINPTPEAHQKVIDEFEKLGASVTYQTRADGAQKQIRGTIHNQDYVNVSDYLFHLRKDRNSMDYHDDLSTRRKGRSLNISGQATLSIKQTEEIFDILKKYK